MKILHAADIHIKLEKNKVPKEWQLDRFRTFFDKMIILEKHHDITVLAGDIFDEKPEVDEMTLFNAYLNRVTIPTFIIPGNHEATKKGETFLQGYVRDQSVNNSNVKFFTKNARTKVFGYWIQFFPYTEVQLNNLEDFREKEILVTHIRGEVPPHITPEYDFEKIKDFKLVLCGDLHFYHKYKNYNVYYPGSPLNVTFDRNDSKKYGVISHIFDDSGHTHEFIDLDLPKLIRKRIKAGENLDRNPYHWIVYEVEGKAEQIKEIRKNQKDLFDKAIIDLPQTKSKLNLKGMNLYDEVKAWLNYTGIEDAQPYIDELVNLNIK